MVVNVVVLKNERALKKMPKGTPQRADITVVNGVVVKSRLSSEHQGLKWKTVAKLIRADGYRASVNAPEFLNMVKRGTPLPSPQVGTLPL